MTKHKHSGAAALAITALLLVSPNISYAGGVLPDSLDYTYKLYYDQSHFDTPMPVAFDGANYWASSGGGTTSPLQKFDPLTGDSLSYYVPGIDYRSTFANASGTIFASGYNDNQIYQMTSPGSFTSVLTLQGPAAPDSQAPVILSPDGTQYASRIGNTINLWSVADGSFQTSIVLGDYGTVSGEDAVGSGQVDLNLAAFGSYYLTYLNNGSGPNMVYAWDSSGNRVGDLQLLNNENGDAYSFGYSNGYVFTSAYDGEYHGYQLAATVSAPEPGSLALCALGLVGFIGRCRRQKRAY